MAPPKGADTAPEILSQAFAEMSIADKDRRHDVLDEYKARPGFGSLGRPIDIVANCYLARFNGAAPTVYHYDVEINPVVKVNGQRKPKDLLIRIWAQACKEATGNLKKGLETAAFDNVKNAWSSSKLCPNEQTPSEIIIALTEDGQAPDDDRRRFKVVIRFAATVDLESVIDFCKGSRQTEAAKEMMLTALQAMNVLMRQDPNERYKQVGGQGKRFFELAGGVSISGGGIIHQGVMQSFRPAQIGLPVVQLKDSYSAFVQAGMGHEVAAGLLGRGGGGGGFRGGGRGGPRGGPRGGRGGPPAMQQGGGGLDRLTPRETKKLNNLLKGAKFNLTHRPTSRVYSVKAITSAPASDLSFNLEGKDGKPDRKVTVVQYYQEQFNVRLTKPGLPCVSYGPKNYVPLELVRFLPFHQIPLRFMTSDQTADMIKVAAKAPPARRATIQEWRTKLNYDNLPKLRAWGLQVQSQMLALQGRMLPPPKVSYKSGETAAMNGGWNLRGGVNKFIKAGKPLKAWSAVSFDRNIGVSELQRFMSDLIKNLKANGVVVENDRPPCIQVNPDNANVPNGQLMGIKVGLRDAAVAVWQQTKLDPQLVVVVEPRKDTEFKAEIKRVAAEGLKSPIVTQVLLAQNFRKEGPQRDQLLNNITMKINLKLGGATHSVNLKSLGIDNKVMIVGADVGHPPARGGGPIGPSIAVSVAAIDGDNTVYKPAIRLQEGRVEMIAALEDMMYNHIKVFEKNSRYKPDKILFYRDGVSEGQYAQCVEYEVSKIRAACRRFGDTYKPKITFVIAAKRHHMRFFAAREGADTDKNGNIKAGLVVDRAVTHPTAFDFYLQAHSGLQGTAKPTHYVVMVDENSFTADKLQALTNNLCYTFARATRSVSLVPPAYYADIIATAARDLVYHDDDDSAQSETTVSAGAGASKNEYNPLRFKERFEDHATFGNVAWYM